MLKIRLTAIAAAAVSGLMIGPAAQAQSAPALAPAPAPAPAPAAEPITEARPLPGPGAQTAPAPAPASDPSLAPIPLPGTHSLNPGNNATPAPAGAPANWCPPGSYDQGYYQGGYDDGTYYGYDRYSSASFGPQGRIPRDYAWQRPVRRPIWRTPVVYRQFWPSSYYGANGAPQGYARALPPVYQPTDTTQQGYYYQQVPMWQPNPAMLPPAPWPWDWHHMVPATAYNARGEWDDNEYIRAQYGAAQAGYGAQAQQPYGNTIQQ